MAKRKWTDEQYEAHKERNRTTQAEKSAAGRDVAESCPKCIDLEARDRFAVDLRFALETLFPSRFTLGWSDDHIELINDIQNAIDTGEQLARALPRGTGKTSLLICAIIVAVLTGKHLFAVLIGATESAAKELLEQITTELESNDELYAYFPEIIHPIRCLEGIHQRKLLWNGEPIVQSWKKDRIILPSLPAVAGASAIIKTAGLLGRIRGMNYQRPDGQNVRPTFVLIDDPQTDASAISDRENDKRESVICSTIPGLAGPGKKTSVVVTVTVKARGDMADRLLDRQKHPEWHGKRTALLRSIPTNNDLWNQYSEILRECQRRDEPITRATDFYRANQQTMDEGGEASWPARFNSDEFSGIQYAMNIKIANPAAFASEYQNKPLVLEEFNQQTDSDKVVLRVSGYARGVLPIDSEILVAGIDVQKNYLVYVCGGFAMNSTPWIVDYGTYPDQRTSTFDRRSSTRTIEAEFDDGDPDSKLWRALEKLEALLLAKAFKRDGDGSPMSFKKLAIDVRYKGQVIKRFAKASAHRDIWLPAQGLQQQLGAQGINDRPAQPGEISKHGFRLPPLRPGMIARTASFDSNEYIGKVHDALNTPAGSSGALTLFNAEPHQHRNWADQVCAEYSTWVEAKGRKQRVWKLKPNGGDNDFLDATKLMFLAAYVAGVEPTYVAKPKPQPSSNKPRQDWFAAI